MANRYTSLGRTSAYCLRLTALELADLQTRADARGITVADIIRDALGFRVPDSTCTTGTCGHYEHRLAQRIMHKPGGSQ
jgi:hypothetical protein